MTEFSYDNIEKSIDVLHLNLSIAELAKLSEENSLTTDQMAAFDLLLEHLREKKIQTTINTLLKMSRLPLKNPKTFDNFDFSIVKGKDIDRLKALPSLAAIHAHKNLAFIGPAGIGKTHLALAKGMNAVNMGSRHTLSRCPSYGTSSPLPEETAKRLLSSTVLSDHPA